MAVDSAGGQSIPLRRVEQQRCEVKSMGKQIILSEIAVHREQAAERYATVHCNAGVYTGASLVIDSATGATRLRGACLLFETCSPIRQSSPLPSNRERVQCIWFLFVARFLQTTAGEG